MLVHDRSETRRTARRNSLRRYRQLQSTPPKIRPFRARLGERRSSSVRNHPDIGRVRAKLGRHWPRFARGRPDLTRVRPMSGRHGPKFTRTSPNLARRRRGRRVAEASQRPARRRLCRPRRRISRSSEPLGHASAYTCASSPHQPSGSLNQTLVDRKSKHQPCPTKHSQSRLGATRRARARAPGRPGIDGGEARRGKGTLAPQVSVVGGLRRRALGRP